MNTRHTAMGRTLVAVLILGYLTVGLGCANKAQQGAGVGALAGATIGALTFNNKLTGAAVGAGVGLLMGYIVGNEWDKHDEAQVQRSLEKNPSGQTSTWTNPYTQQRYSATPGDPYMEDGRVYRDVVIRDDKDGEKFMAKAWRDDNGVWHLKQ